MDEKEKAAGTAGGPRVFAPKPAGTKPRAHVFAPTPPRLALGITIGHGDFPNAVLQGSTANFKVFRDPALGAAGVTIAKAVLASCERDYNTIKGFFGGITPPVLPFNVVIVDLTHTNVGACGGATPAGGGAYHCGCSGVDIYCDVKITPAVDPKFTEFLNMAEVVEVFEAAQGGGWNCGASNGEGLSRVLATELYPAELGGFDTAADWLDGGRPDFVNSTAPTDGNSVSNGCSVLFLNYLRHQLGHSWGSITQAAAATLAQTYAKLTGDTKNPFPAFKALLDSKFPPGKPSGLTTDNPWPIHKPPKPPGPKPPKPPGPKPPKPPGPKPPKPPGPKPPTPGPGPGPGPGPSTGTTGVAPLGAWVPPPTYPFLPAPPPTYPVPPVPPPVGELAQRAVTTLMRSPALGIVAVVGLVVVGTVGVVALSEGGCKPSTG